MQEVKKKSKFLMLLDPLLLLPFEMGDLVELSWIACSTYIEAWFIYIVFQLCIGAYESDMFNQPV